MLLENTLFETVDLVAVAIARLQTFEPPEGYYLADSGGKDSGVVLDLLIKSGCKFDAHYQWTTVDPPELLFHIRKHHPETEIHKPDITMWNLIPLKRMPPTRLVRYCCEYLKEGGGDGRLVVTGVRWEESLKRSKRRMVESCQRSKSKRYLHPIIDWSESDIWEYHRQYDIPYCSLYDEGFKRLGCIGCPTVGASKMQRDFARWPKHYQAYIRAFQRCIDKRKVDGLKTDWSTGEDMMQWWLQEKTHKGDPDQTILFE